MATELTAPENQPESDEVFLQQLEAVMMKMLPSLKASLLDELKTEVSSLVESKIPTTPATPAEKLTKKAAATKESERIQKLEESLRKSNLTNALSIAKNMLNLDPDLLNPLVSMLTFDNDLMMPDGRDLIEYLSEFAETEIGAKYKIPEQKVNPQGFNNGLLPVTPGKEFPYASIFQF